MNQPQVVCFDIGNVFIFPDGGKIAKVIQEQLNLQLDPTACSEAFLRADRELYRLKIANQQHSSDFVQLWASFSGVPKQMTAAVWNVLTEQTQHRYWTVLDSDALEVLQGLSQAGYTLAAISNTDGKLVEDLTSLGIMKFFSCVLDSQIIGIEKPDVRIYQLCASLLQLEPEQCCYIGDTVSELIGSREAGIELNILYDPLYLHQDIDEFPKVHSLAELYTMLQSF